MKKLLLLIFTCLLTGLANAQDNGSEPEMVTDRPSVGDAATIVPRGYYQVEAGFFYQRDETNFINQREMRYPEVVARLGLLKFAELRVGGQLARIRTKTVSTAPE